MKKIIKTVIILAALSLATGAWAANFTAGNVVVYRVGDGSTNALVNSGSPVFLDEYDLNGNPVQSISIPTNAYFGANAPLIANGAASAEGLMTRSVDGRFLVFTGFATSIGAGSSALASLSAQTVPRVIATMDQSTRLNSTTLQTNTLSSGDDIRSAASTDGTNIWFSGDSSGIRYTTRGSTAATQLEPDLTNIRQVNIYNSTLYFSTASGTAIRLGVVTNGLPTTSGSTYTNLPGTATTNGSPYAFAFFNLPGGPSPINTLYIADDGGTGGIYKWSLVGSSWVSNGVVLFTNARYLVGTNTSGGNVKLVAAGAPAAGAGPYFGGGNMVGYTDTTGYNAAPVGNGDPGGIGDVADWAVNPPANAAFRGIAFAPVGSETFPSGSPQLSVGPITDVFFSKGFTGGPITFTKNYSVANFGVGTMTWSVSAANNWVGLSPSSGTLGSGGSITVTVSFNNANANALAPGTNVSSISFTNSTSGNTGSDFTTRPVTLILSQIGVTPSSNYFANGPVGGPYTPSTQIYTLTNGSANSLSWGASAVSSNWLTFTPSSGAIAAGGTANVTVAITNANALALSRGAFVDTIMFTNSASSDPGNAARSVSLLTGGGFTSNNLVIYRAGDGVAALNNQPTPVFIDEYTRSGVLIQTVPVSTNNYSCSGVATAEGLMTRSTDKHYLVFVGYGTNKLYGAPAPASLASVVPRVIGRVDGNCNVDVSTRLTDYCSGSNPRAAVSTNGVDMWVAGATNGVRHTFLGATSSSDVCTNPVQNFRALNIYSNQLYAGTASGSVRITTVGSGLPTTDSLAVNLPGYSTNEVSPYNFVLFQLKPGGTDPFDTLYVADDQNNSGASDNGNGAVFKWSLVGGNWTSNGFVIIHAVRGLAGDVSIVGTTTNVNLFAVGSQNSTGGSGTLTAYTDSTGYNAAPSGNGTTNGTVAIATASANKRWDSVSLAPEIPNTAAISLTPGDFIVIDGPSSVTTNSKNYLVSDVSNSSMTWTATWTSSWLSLSHYGGALAAGGDTNVVVSINGNATTLANGTYLDTISFVNTVNGQGNTTRGVSLTITGSVVVVGGYAAWQTQYFGCTGCPQAQGGADPFGKGMSNTNQFLAGFDPTNKSAYVHITAVSKTNATDVRVDYLGASGNSSNPPPIASRTNVLEFTTGTGGNYNSNSFASTGQTNILSGGAGQGLLTNMVDPGGATAGATRYYRVRVLVP
ncbi:MAG TPA: hypothetical protein VNL17_08275 [Verrucomicrobiae bacterium]|nr:hypothetical protein [Verrucomicrobiae bacterium]